MNVVWQDVGSPAPIKGVFNKLLMFSCIKQKPIAITNLVR